MKLKKTILILLALALPALSFAQFRLNGKIKGYTGTANLQLNIPLVYGFHQENTIQFPIAKDGTFNVAVPIKETKLATLVFEGKRYNLLLHPNKTLTFEANTADTSLRLLAGTALPENKLLLAIGFKDSPFFLNDDGSTFNKLALNGLLDSVVKPFKLAEASKINRVQASSLSNSDKQIISNEIAYRDYFLLDMYARTAGLQKATMDSLVLAIFDKAPLKPKTLIAGSYYYDFIDSYLKYIETKAFKKVKEEQIPSSDPLPYYGISMDSAMVVIKKNGKPYGIWIGASKNLPMAVVEPFTYQQLTNLYNEKNLGQLSALAKVFNQQFPNSIYNKDIKAKTASLQKMLSANASNKKIEIAEGFEKISSIASVIKPLKGKVVYLDVWGTWCGPCKEELKSVPALKARFKGKDVAFVYLDMDEDDKDATWREFIKVNGMEGLHLRKGRANIAPFWKELLANAEDKSEYYPQFFIFDKTGKLVVAKAKRPSDKEELYQQIENVLNQK
ncbi:TlpA disulfide reductase family protein [Pedobacter sp. KR3-3]|uniref:TlpA disulfide reductase family protein n=1 Tax=Pedobacter albus TaxID=3113905 RepID=A0ABU7I8H4_9SPHI|nr:TlpA disulfide reductase family protein [Pedobacter sp. KR3-3]MEE1945768.1 TlpA disulfide reductase family protein [Pedobacter sp. KR3-3]